MEHKGFNFCLRYPARPISYVLPSPCANLHSLYHFHSSFVQRLAESKQCQSNQLQLNVWPLITSGCSLSAIGSTRSGKTVSYVLFILNRFWLGGYFNEQPLIHSKPTPVSGFQVERYLGSKIYSIVIINSLMSSVKIEREFLHWIEVLKLVSVEHKKTLRILQLNSSSSLKDYFEVINGCSVLIATPPALSRLIQMDLVSINDCRLLVVDNADQIDATVMEEFLHCCQQTTNTNIFTGQTLLFSRSWTEDLQRFFFQFQQNPVLVFSSLVSASVVFKQSLANRIYFSYQASNIYYHLEQILLTQLKPSDLAAIICTSFEQISSVAHFVNQSEELRKSVQVFKMGALTTMIDLDRILSDVLHKPTNLMKIVLLHSDDIFNLAFCCRRFSFLLHLDPLADCMDEFECALNFRLWLTYDNLAMLALRDSLAEPKPNPLISNHFLLSPQTHSKKHSKRFKQLMISLLEYCSYLHLAEGSELALYVQNEIHSDICPQFMSFAKCSKVDQRKACWQGRHWLLSESTPDHFDCLPTRDCQIKFRISHVVATNQFYVNIIAYRSACETTGQWVSLAELTDHEVKIKQHLSNLGPPFARKPIEPIPLTVGSVHALYHLDQWVRVKIIALHQVNEMRNLPIWLNSFILSDEQMEFVKLVPTVFAIDVGFTVECKSFDLVPIEDEQVREIRPLACRTLLADIQPPDGGYSWTNLQQPHASATTENLLMQLHGEDKANYLHGWVLARSGSTVWLHKVMLVKHLKQLQIAQSTCWKSRLVQAGVALPNQRLFQMVDYGAHRKVKSVWTWNKQQHLIRFEKLAVREGNNNQNVFKVAITRFEDLDRVYVNLADQREKLCRLERKWAVAIEKVVEASAGDPGERHWHRGMVCLHLENGSAKRCQLVAIDENHSLCVLVYLDYGTERFDVPLGELHQIEDFQITILPMQAICLNLSPDCEYSLAGKDNRPVLQKQLAGLECLAVCLPEQPNYATSTHKEMILFTGSQLEATHQYFVDLFFEQSVCGNLPWKSDFTPTEEKYVNFHAYFEEIGFLLLAFTPDSLVEPLLDSESDSEAGERHADIDENQYRTEISLLFKAINQCLLDEQTDQVMKGDTVVNHKHETMNENISKENVSVKKEESVDNRDRELEDSNSIEDEEERPVVVDDPGEGQCEDYASDSDASILHYDPFSSSEDSHSEDEEGVRSRKPPKRPSNYEVINADFEAERFDELIL